MTSNGTPRRPRVHTRHGLTREVRSQLAELGRQLPPRSKEEVKIVAIARAERLLRRLSVALVWIVIFALIAGGIVQWFRPLPPPTLSAFAIRAPGAPPRLPWPSSGEAALSVSGLVSVHNDASNRPVPAGVLAGVMTAYVILKEHPLANDQDTGPTIKVTAQTLAAFRNGRARGEPEIPVTLGESLSELDALEGLLIDSGSDMATLLADWDARSPSGFVSRMDHYALALGLTNTSITGPGGVNNAMITTPSDLVRLAEVAMRIPTFRQIVSLGEVSLPGAGLQYNPNFVLGENGVVGIDVGAATSTYGCYLFAARKIVSGQTVTLYGVVLGQSGPIGPDTAAVDAGDSLIKAALADIIAVPIKVGRVAGRLAAPWGASTLVTVAQAVTIPAWPGLDLAVTTRLAKLTLPVAPRTQVGWLELRQGSRTIEVAVRSVSALEGNTGLWRLER